MNLLQRVNGVSFSDSEASPTESDVPGQGKWSDWRRGRGQREEGRRGRCDRRTDNGVGIRTGDESRKRGLGKTDFGTLSKKRKCRNEVTVEELLRKRLLR